MSTLNKLLLKIEKDRKPMEMRELIKGLKISEGGICVFLKLATFFAWTFVLALPLLNSNKVLCISSFSH